MKKIITVFTFCFLFGECFSQSGEWVWLKGDSITNPPGNYGVQGIPAPANTPPGLYEACEWTDLNGNFWLFGGTYSPFAGNNSGDLWKYDPGTNEWTWMKGTGLANDAGNYGTMGIPALTNHPPAMAYGMSSWTDLNGDLWLYGGYWNDLWRYTISTNTWTWIDGTGQTSAPAVYGTQGIPSPGNSPGSRNECAATWIDLNGDLWLFGGHAIGLMTLNDLWRYSISTNEWTWMKGSTTTNQPGVYGTLGIPDVANVPGGRWSYCTWKDTGGNFWLFGGRTYPGSFEDYNDMWMYDPLSNNWTWKNGSSLSQDTGSYGSLCAASVNYLPSARYENRARWTSACGKFWFYGGAYSTIIPDLWYFDPSNSEWTLVNGTLSIQYPVYGTIGIPAPANTPGRRWGSISWLSNTGALYIFGGYVDGIPFTRCGNDLWKYTIDTACTGVCLPSYMIENGFKNDLLIFPNPTNSSLTISFSSSEKQIVELRIYNTLGKEVYFSKEEISKGKFEKEINVEKLSEGIYFLQLKMKDGMLSRKVIKSGRF